MKKRTRVKEHRLNLRLLAPTVQAIEKLRHEGNGKLSYNAWIQQAIQEKLDRDSVREIAAPRYADSQRTFYEFFAGAGMARMGLGSEWTCLFANDIDATKARAYRENWSGAAELMVTDINNVTTKDLPGHADLVWASFPCQDLSVAGKSKGIGRRRDEKPTRSGTFWRFWHLIDELIAEGRRPKVIVLENVVGVLTSNGGKDFAAICSALQESGFRFGALIIDAKLFVPQSRPRVFIVAASSDLFIDEVLMSPSPVAHWNVRALEVAHNALPEEVRRNWIWWNLPLPPARHLRFIDLIEDPPSGVEWHTAEETKKLLAMMSPVNRDKVEKAKRMRSRVVGGIYRRTRFDSDGSKIQRAEVRFDDVAGCLRTPTGGSSRQLIMVIEGTRVRSRLLSPREAARLMGLPDTYRLPKNYNDAYYLAGDGVVVPVVSHLANYLINPIVDENRIQAVLPFRAA